MLSSGQRQEQGQQRSAKTMPLEFMIDSQAAYAHGGHGWTARQLLAVAGRKIGQKQAGRRQGAESRCALPARQGHKAGGDATANVLTGLLAQVAIEESESQWKLAKSCAAYSVASRNGALLILSAGAGCSD